MKPRISGMLIFFTLLFTPVLAHASNKTVELGGVTFTQNYANVNGVTIHFVSGGHGNPVLLLHGYPETWYDWRKVMPILSQHYTVIAPDMRGLGDSSRPADGDYSKKSVADDLYKVVKGLGYKQIYLVGQDMGGPVAAALAGAHPNFVRKMVAIETGIPGYGLESAMDTAHGGSWHFGLFADTPIALLLTKGREKQFFTAWAFRGAFVFNKSTFTNADINEYVRHYASPGGMAAGFGYYKAFAQDAVYNASLFSKTKLTFPILAVGGDHAFRGFTLMNMQRIGTDVHGVILKNCGHFVNEEKPVQLSHLIVTFFNETDAPPS